MRGTAPERFWAKVDTEGPGGCWVWTASTHLAGYGVFWNGKRLVGAHRWSYENLVGPIPAQLYLDHLCRNPPCVNPAHLEIVTNRENVLRGMCGAVNAARMRAIPACPAGHLYAEHGRTRPDGKRECRICRAEQAKRYAPSRREYFRQYAAARQRNGTT